MNGNALAEILDISPQRLGKLTDVDLEAHNLMRLTAHETDLVVQNQLRRQLEKILALSTSEATDAKMADACATLRKVLEPFAPEIMDRNIAVMVVKMPNGEREVLFSVNNIERVPGTIPPQDNRFFPHGEDWNSRANDSEAKGLNYIAQFFEHETYSGLDETLRPVIELFSEQYACDSCAVIINDAKLWFAERGVTLKSSAVYVDEPSRKSGVAKRLLEWGDK
jgi:hypothetical protein